MRPISMERVEKTRENILGIITNKALTHEQKLTNLANAADGPQLTAELARRHCGGPPFRRRVPAAVLRL